MKLLVCFSKVFLLPPFVSDRAPPTSMFLLLFGKSACFRLLFLGECSTFRVSNLNPECVNLTLPTEPVSHPQFIGGLSGYVSYLSRDAFPSAFLLPGTLAAIIKRGWGSLWLARTHDAPTRTDDLNFRAQRQGRDHGSARNRSKMGTLTNS